MKAILLLFILLIACEKIEVDPNTFIDDRDGQRYATVQVGDNTWMAENLNYRPGGYNYMITDKYGILYPFREAVRYCPKGWRLPTPEEWEEVKDYFPDDIALRTGEFKAKLSGWVQGEYMNKGRIGVWWTDTECFDKYAWVYYFAVNGFLARTNFYKTNMAGVRCIKISD